MVTCGFCPLHMICEQEEPSLPPCSIALNATDSRVLLTYLGHPMGMNIVTSRDISKSRQDWTERLFFLGPNYTFIPNKKKKKAGNGALSKTNNALRWSEILLHIGCRYCHHAEVSTVLNSPQYSKTDRPFAPALNWATVTDFQLLCDLPCGMCSSEKFVRDTFGELEYSKVKQQKHHRSQFLTSCSSASNCPTEMSPRDSSWQALCLKEQYGKVSRFR